MKRPINCVDSQMEDILAETEAKMQPKKQNPGLLSFKRRYASKMLAEVSWTEVCADARECKCGLFAFTMFTRLLEKRLYAGESSDALYRLLPLFREILDGENAGRGFCSNRLLCGEKIDSLILVRSSGNGGSVSRRYVFFQAGGDYLKAEVAAFLNSPRTDIRQFSDNALASFEASLGDCGDLIMSYRDFNERTFFRQIAYYQENFEKSDLTYRCGIRIVCFFYRWLVNRYDEYDFFKNAFSMTKYLLFSPALPRLIKRGYYFTTFNPHAEYEDRVRFCFIVRGMDSLSTTLTGEDFFSIDLSKLSEACYRKAVIKYMQTSCSVSEITWCGYINFITDGLRFLVELKKREGYPNPSLTRMTDQEAVMLRNYYYDEHQKIGTLNNKIGAMRRFLQWCQRCGLISFSDTFFDYLRQYEEPAAAFGRAIPDERLALLNNYILKDMREHDNAVLAYAVFHLLLQTEFRVSQICHLKTDCIRPSAKPGQYVVTSVSKTSHGARDNYVITQMTYEALMKAMEATDSIRDECVIESLCGYIFIRRTPSGSYGLFKSKQFLDYMSKACSVLGFETTYGASNLRDTHMTKAFEHILRSGGSDMELSLLSSHKRVDTTKNHYIDFELEKMLEATYGITIGEVSIETDSKVVDAIPDNVRDKDSDVENGCGKCAAHECVSLTSLPCLVCEHFITTIAHEPFFKESVARLDALIASAANPHDREDLLTMKKLHVLYLKSIYKRREEL